LSEQIIIQRVVRTSDLLLILKFRVANHCSIQTEEGEINSSIMHRRRRRRDSTVELSRVGCVYWASEGQKLQVWLVDCSNYVMPRSVIGTSSSLVLPLLSLFDVFDVNKILLDSTSLALFTRYLLFT